MKIFGLSLFIVGVWSDCYMHNPKGSNNRLSENSANRDNGDRLFDSQNNNRGGYNVGEKTSSIYQIPYGEPEAVFNDRDFSTPMQYQMAYYEGSTLQFEWTNQHGCGGNEETDPHILNCQIIWQYMCDIDQSSDFKDGHMNVGLRDGGNTNDPDHAASWASLTNVVRSNINSARGLHENEAYYLMCENRERNRGLFWADQNKNGGSSRHTRQNNNGNRRGLECPEERDYYPYWNPSPWRDIAYLTDRVDMCDWIKATSQNNNPVSWCDGLLELDQMDLIPITEEKCIEMGGTWKHFNKNLPPPACDSAPWTRDNHLGNGRKGVPVSWNWTIPAYDDLINSGLKETDTGFLKCVVRIRYNMTTDDYDPWNTYDDRTDNAWTGVSSPVRQDPSVDVGTGSLEGLALAINTNQFGRTFQDRSHIFYIRKKPVPEWANKKIWNLNVKGRRGNVVETYPSTPYEFIPNRVHVQTGDLIHVQWTGSNTHTNGDPAGDGASGNQGEGLPGTDRHNMVQILEEGDNYPLPLDKFGPTGETMWNKVNCYDQHGVRIANYIDCALILATGGYFRSMAAVNNTMDPTLNNAPPSLVGGIVLEFLTSGETFHYMSTRNNIFSDMSQKGTIVVD